jgi:dephospho-CoA kinase
VYLVGLTGGIAAGKSTVAARLVQRGAELVDADDVAREIVLPGTDGWREIVEAFGRAVLDEDGFVDRGELAREVFYDESKRALLNEITHPRITEEIAERLEVLAPFDGMVVLDIPLLAELGLDREHDPAKRSTPHYDAIVVVAAQRDTQMERLQQQRDMSPSEAAARIDAQASMDEKLALADHVIWNEGTLAQLGTEADRVADELIAAARDKAARAEQGLPND